MDSEPLGSHCKCHLLAILKDIQSFFINVFVEILRGPLLYSVGGEPKDWTGVPLEITKKLCINPSNPLPHCQFLLIPLLEVMKLPESFHIGLFDYPSQIAEGPSPDAINNGEPREIMCGHLAAKQLSNSFPAAVNRLSSQRMTNPIADME